MQYAERDTQRILLLTPDGSGLWQAEEDPDFDPLVTLVRRFGRAIEAGSVLCPSLTNTVFTPAAGHALRLKWIHIGTPTTASDTVVTVKLGTNVHYQIPMSAPGGFMRTSIREGGTDAPLVVELSVPTDVYVNYELEEFA